MTTSGERPARSIFTVGHSNHSLERFLELLRAHQVEVLADVRSAPWSRFAPHFNGDALRETIVRAGMKYVFLGRELGGRPEQAEFYDDENHVRYDRLAESPEFVEGIERVERGAETYRVALMCSEEDPATCHRHLLVGRVLAGRGTVLAHIRGDGSLESDETVSARAQPDVDRRQRLLFIDLEAAEWRSIRSVSPRKPPNRSSES